jgi:hypothetical protein
MKPEEVAATAGKVDIVSEEFAQAIAALPKLYNLETGEVNKEVLHLFMGASQPATQLTGILRGDFDCHEAGLLVKFAATHNKVADEVNRYIATLTKTVGPGTPGFPRKLVEMLTDIAGIARQNKATLDQATSMYDIATKLPEQLKAYLPEWFATRLPNPAPGEIAVVLHRMKAVFQTRIEQFAALRQAEAGKDTFDAADTAQRAEKCVTTSKFVQPYIQGGYVSGTITKSLKVLNDAQFTLLQYEDFHARNKDLFSTQDAFWRALIADHVDNVEGFQSNGQIYIRRSVKRPLSTCVHEAFHLLADANCGGAWRRDLGMPLDEGVTEYLCRLLCTEQKIDYKLDGYHNNVLLLETIMEKGNITDADLLNAYLGGQTKPVIEAIRKISGEEGLAVLRRGKDQECYDTYYAWVAEYKKVQGDGWCVIL